MKSLDKEEADRLIEKAKLCLRSGRTDRALQLLYEAQNIYPSTRARGKISRLWLLSSQHFVYIISRSSHMAPQLHSVDFVVSSYIVYICVFSYPVRYTGLWSVYDTFVFLFRNASCVVVGDSRDLATLDWQFCWLHDRRRCVKTCLSSCRTNTNPIQLNVWKLFL